MRVTAGKNKLWESNPVVELVMYAYAVKRAVITIQMDVAHVKLKG
jgi:hypothetical protein